ncbi:hypothetical protein SNE40_006453 [Patella caerulea]|uniref:Uncharacterized protein n=1 Tax=Patella caerulea TaxID=87958 RepID=A0AAN8K3R5_PATCE
MESSRMLVIAPINSVGVFVFVVSLLTSGLSEKIPGENSLHSEEEQPQIVQGIITTDGKPVENLFINDNTQENIIHLHQRHYDTFIIKRYATNKALLLVQSDDDQIHYCEEWNLTNETFIPASVFLNAEFRSSDNSSTVTRSFHTVDIIDLPIIPYSTCQDIPPSLLAGKPLQ